MYHYSTELQQSFADVCRRGSQYWTLNLGGDSKTTTWIAAQRSKKIPVIPKSVLALFISCHGRGYIFRLALLLRKHFQKLQITFVLRIRQLCLTRVCSYSLRSITTTKRRVYFNKAFRLSGNCPQPLSDQLWPSRNAPESLSHPVEKPPKQNVAKLRETKLYRCSLRSSLLSRWRNPSGLRRSNLYLMLPAPASVSLFLLLSKIYWITPISINWTCRHRILILRIYSLTANLNVNFQESLKSRYEVETLEPNHKPPSKRLTILLFEKLRVMTHGVFADKQSGSNVLGDESDTNEIWCEYAPYSRSSYLSPWDLGERQARRYDCTGKQFYCLIWHVGCFGFSSPS